MLYKVVVTKKFNKSLKRYKRSGSFDIQDLLTVIDLLSTGSDLPISFKDHGLNGIMKGYRECHVLPDLLLVYFVDLDSMNLRLINLGSHSELFG